MAYNKINALRDNIAAIRVALGNESGNNVITAQERDILAKYSGFGGLKEVRYWQHYMSREDVRADQDHIGKDMAALVFELYQTVEGYFDGDEDKTWRVMNSISESTLNAFYTPNEVVSAVGRALNHVMGVFDIRSATFLDPSAGIGAFLPAAPEGCKTVAFEIDWLTSEILKALHPEAEVYNEGFERITKRREANDWEEDVVLNSETRFDITASNIPFSRFGIHDAVFEKGDSVHRLSLEKIHRYFFVKALEELEDGGILAFVTSRGIADTQECDYLRQWLVEQGNLLAAVRLPDNLFMQGSGVEVGSDLIVVQRDTHKGWQTTTERQFMESKDKSLTVDGRSAIVPSVNSLLSQRRHALYTHRRLDTDQWGKMKCKYYWREGMDRFEQELASNLMQSMERCFHLSAWQYGHDEERKERERAERERDIEKMRRGRERHDKMVQECRPLYDKLMQTFNTLSSGEQRDKREYAFEREELNRLYDEWVEKYGPLHKVESILKHYPEYQRALSLERKEGRQWVKADIFDHPVHFHQAGDGFVTPMEALSISLNEFGRVKMSYIEQLTGKSEEDVYDALRGEIFMMPEQGKEDGFLEYQHKSLCINGNVLLKKKQVDQYAAGGGLGDYQRRALADTLSALEAAIPEPIPYDSIDMQMGVRWLPTKFYSRFLTWLFKCEQTTVHYYPEGDMFHFDYPDYWYNSEGGYSGPYAYSDKGFSGFSIFEFAIEDKVPEIKMSKPIYGPDGKITGYDSDKKVRDEKSIQAVQEKISLVREKFDEFMHSEQISEEERDEIARTYNETMNCSIRANYDGSMQTFPGLDFKALGFQDLYQSQKDCIWMIKQLGGGIAWHEVGGGKTMIMIVSAMEMKRLGLCNKPMIICLKATVGQIAETFRKAYPNARLLCPGQKDFTKKNRKEFIDQIAHNDWDCIIMTYDQFYKIPQDRDVLRSVFDNEIKDLAECIQRARTDGMSRDAMRGLQERQKSLQNRLNKLDDKLEERTDDVLSFKECQIDMLFVDEYHNFKNLGFNTHYNRVAGVGKTDGTDKTMTLLAAVRTIQEKTGKDLGAAFFSGTVVANALTELYVAFKYLRPKELKRTGMQCFDAWASNFCQKITDYDLNTMAQIQSKERFRSYLNIPELSMMLREITDFRTAEMINLDRPKANIIEDFADPNEEQRVMLERLMDYASTGNWCVLGLEEKAYQDNSKQGSTALIATNLARDISLDIRLMGATQFHDDPQNKINRCACRIAKYYKKYDEHRGVQFVFCDVSKSKDAKGWNMYDELREKLIEAHGIPAHEIAFIHDYDTDTRKAKLFEALNNGDIRVIVGTTQKLGTGVNAQRRAVAVHHLDIPWRPADLEQRNGRAVRAGNEVKLWGNNTVDIIVYGTNRTLDAYKFRLLQNKAFFLKQINNGSVNARHMEEDSMTEEGGMPYAEMVAQLSGNQDLLVKAKLDAQVARLKSSKSNYQKAVRSAESKIKDNERQIENIGRVIPIQQEDLRFVEKFMAEHGNEPCLTVIGSKDNTPDELARALMQYRTEVHEDGLVVGNVYGLPIRMTTSVNHITGEPTGNQFEVIGLRGIAYRCDKNRNGAIGQSLEVIFHAFDSLPDAIRKRIADNETGIRTREADTRACRTTIDTPWPHEQELIDKQRELDEVSARVQAVLDAEEAARQAKVAALTAEKE